MIGPMTSDAPSPALVSLIGAGPGDPGLITRRAAARLATADVVLYDALAHPSLLSLAAPHAELEYVGKRAGRRSARQTHINARMIECAQSGRRVVRLKGGDPYLFGRGSEEAEALAEAGVPFEVVPGVPSPLAATAYAGISLTHRDLASSVAYVTATESADKDRSAHDWSRLATATETLVIFMGMRKLRSLMSLLMEHGRSPETPAAVIHAASWPHQQTVVATVATLADAAEGLGLPSLIVVGNVVRLRERLRWFDNRPLFGRRVLVPRPAHQAEKLATTLRAAGADPVCIPAIRLQPLAVAADEWGFSDADWVVFTSANAVDHTFGQLKEQGMDARALGGVQVAAIGAKTAQALLAEGIRADLVPEHAHAEGLRDAMLRRLEAPSRLLVPRAKVARPLFVDAMEAAGHSVRVLPVYETVGMTEADRRRLEEALPSLDAVVLTSSSIADELHRAAPQAMAEKALFSIGPATTKTLQTLGYTATQSPQASIESLVDTLSARYEER